MSSELEKQVTKPNISVVEGTVFLDEKPIGVVGTLEELEKWNIKGDYEIIDDVQDK